MTQRNIAIHSKAKAMLDRPASTTRREVLKSLLLTSSAAAILPQEIFADPPPRRLPNIVVILADDIGYGDISAYGATVVHTPNIDKLARSGLRFTDAHCDAATCTPSRYAMMTGNYAWRKDGAHILAGNSAALIPPGQPTVQSQLRLAGYATGCVGKWHLGLGSPLPNQTGPNTIGDIDWNGDIHPGPNEIGFDYAFFFPATADRVPTVYIENHRVVGLDPKDPIVVDYRHRVGTEPTGLEHPELLKMPVTHEQHDTIVNSISRIGYVSGGVAARWVDETLAATFTAKASQFIEQHKNGPFYLYLATSDIHVPRDPNKQFVNTTACGTRCDAIAELDWTVGRIVDQLTRLNLLDDTLILFTSDNGPIVDDGYDDGSLEHLNGHTPAGPFAGGKFSILEGGTRIPFIVHWPGHVRPGTSPALLGHVDLLATFSALAGVPVPDVPLDSLNLLPVLLGQSTMGRESIVEEADVLALRKGQWKLIDDNARIGRPNPRHPGDTVDPFRLFDLSNDIGESKNLALTYPDKVKELSAELNGLRKRKVS